MPRRILDTYWFAPDPELDGPRVIGVVLTLGDQGELTAYLGSRPFDPDAPAPEHLDAQRIAEAGAKVPWPMAVALFPLSYGTRTRPSYQIWPNIAGLKRAITCLKCGKTSHHPSDVEQRYCGFCHEFHEGMSYPSTDTTWKPSI